MPIYEYQAADKDLSCAACGNPFEALQGINEEPLTNCPQCGNKVRKTISLCRAVVVDGSEEDARVSRTIREYESAGMWSHAAELSDKHSEKTRDASLRDRALENYRKAGYNLNRLTDSEP
jgi:putative FmdB family regulatory protein